MPVYGDGPIPARIMVIGEAPGDNEERTGRPFEGAGGMELNKMLSEAGIIPSECYKTYVVKTRPANNDFTSFVTTKKKDVTEFHVQLRDRYVLPVVIEGYTQLLDEIKMVKPDTIITLGNLPMWILTGAWDVQKWRGSQLETDDGVKLIPTLHPAMLFRDWASRGLAVQDLRRVKRHLGSKIWTNIPNYNFIIRPSLTSVENVILPLLGQMNSGMERWIDFDLETSIATKHIRCAGIAWTASDAICIPLTCTAAQIAYWSEEEEGYIVHLLYKLLTHKNARVRGQNLLFDSQYTHKHWHFIPNVAQDTMISQHSAFCALPKGLDFLSSMYCDYHRQWKLLSWKNT